MNFYKKTFFHPDRFVYLAAPGGPAPGPAAPPGGPPPPPPPGGAPPAAPPAPAANLEALINNTEVLSSEVKARARQALISEENGMYKEQLVEDLLTKKLTQPQFLEELDKLELQEESWRNITKEQRSVRGKIRGLHEKAKSYREIVAPEEEKTRRSERSAFTTHIDAIRGLNSRDQALDNSLRTMLAGATKQTHGGHPVLTKDQAKEIYLLDTKMPDFEKRFSVLTRGIPNIDGRDKFIKRLKSLKHQERAVEEEFERLYNALQLIVERNISRAKREAEKKRAREIASRTVGIHLEPGVALRVEHPGILLIPPKTEVVRISHVEFEEVPIKDHSGKILGYSVGIPKVRIDNGAEMPFSRFKKWVDAQNATEVVDSKNELEEKMGLRELGLHIKEGDTLEYVVAKKGQEGEELKREVKTVSIRKIEKGKIYFYSPIKYQSGIALAEEGVPTEERESLEFGEFLKWYLQNSVFVALKLEDLREHLGTYNKIFNRQFGISSNDNPPIDVSPGEVLYYPDGSGRKFTIQNVSKDRISVEGFEPMTPGQFFLWVRNNNVKKQKPSEARTAKPPTEFRKEETPEAKKSREKKEEEEKARLTQPESLTPLEAIKDFWHQTTFLSMNDIWNMAKSVKDFIVRRHERRSKDRYGNVGSNLPGLLGAEFERIKQAAENEEVNQFKEAMEHWSVERVKETLRHTTKKDIAKACIMVLVHKGEMRWDDPHFWKTLNILTARYTTQGSELFIPSEEKLKALKKSGEDMTQPACDALWGDGTWSEWFSQNINTYNGNKKAFEYKGKQLEADPKGTGGLRGELQRLLKTWREGNYVNPQEYEELIEFAIKYGKMGSEDKMFFLIAGCVARNKHTGETLLHLDRPGDLNGNYLNSYPILDFFTDKASEKPTPPPNGPLKIRPWNLQDYEYWVTHEFPDDYREGKASAQFSQFMWRVMIMNDNTRTRLSKGLRKAEDMDHDDAHIFIPPATVEEIKTVLGSPTGGQKRNFTPEGYANGYPGFNQYILSLSFAVERAESADEQKKLSNALKESLKSFLVYDTTLANRFGKEKGDYYARLGEHHMGRNPVVDSTPPKLHQAQLHTLLRRIGTAYGMSDSQMHVILEEKTGSLHDPTQAARQKKIEQAIEEFLTFIDAKIADQGPEKMLEIVRTMRSHSDAGSPDALRGMRGWTLGRSQNNPQEFLDYMSGKKKITAMQLSELHGGHGGH